MIPEGERPILEVLGENIEKYRKEKGMTVKVLCELASYSSQAYKKLINGECEIRPSTIQKMAFCLEVQTLDLFEDWS